MDNYQMMKVVELELRKQQKRTRRKQREEERERRKTRRASREIGKPYRRELPLPSSSGQSGVSSSSLPALSLAGLSRSSNGLGGDSEWSGSEDAQSHFLIQRDLIPSPTTSECNFMSEEEFRGEFRFGDDDFDEDDDAEEWERSDDDLGTDEESENDLYEDDEGTPRHSYQALGAGLLLGASEEDVLQESGSLQDDAHMAKWLKWERKQRAHGAHTGGSSDDRSGGSDEEVEVEEEENEGQARAAMMPMLKTTAKERQQKGSRAPPSPSIGRTISGSMAIGSSSSSNNNNNRENGGRGGRGRGRVVKRTRSASEKNELANSGGGGGGGGGGGQQNAGGIVGAGGAPPIKVSGDWGEQWLRREGSVCETEEEDEDDRVMLVPEFEEDGAAGGGNIFFLPLESSSGEISLPPRSDSQVQLFVNRALRASQRTDGGGGGERSPRKTREEGGGGSGGGGADPHEHDPPPPPVEPKAKGRDAEPTNAEGESSNADPGAADQPPLGVEGVESGGESRPSIPPSAVPKEKDKIAAPSSLSSPSSPSSPSSSERNETEGKQSGAPVSPSEHQHQHQRQQVVHVGIVAVHTDSNNGHGMAELVHKGTEEPRISPSPRAIFALKESNHVTELARQATEEGQKRANDLQRHGIPTPTMSSGSGSATPTELAKRKDKGKEKLTDDYEDDFTQDAYHDHSGGGGSLTSASAVGTNPRHRGEGRRATVMRRPSAPTTATVVDGGAGATKKEWAWDRVEDSPSSPDGRGGHLRGSSYGQGTVAAAGGGGAGVDSPRTGSRSPRDGATVRSPLLVREESPATVAATSCLSCTLS